MTDNVSTPGDEKIVLTNTNGTAASAINLEASAGGVLVSADGNIASAIKLHATNGTSQTIDLVNTAGELDGSDGAGAINLISTAGIGLRWNNAKDLWAEGGQAVITANHDTADAIKLHADAGSSQTITIVNDEGTSASAINLEASAGGVLVSADGDIASAIKLHATAGTSQTIDIVNTAGTGAGAITLTSTAGGVDINAGAGVTIDAAGASNLTTTSGALTLQGAGGVDIAASGVATTIKGTFNVDEAATFDTTVGVSGALTMDTDKKIQFRDSALFINSSADGQLDIDADTTLQITAPTVDIDASTEVNISNALTVGGRIVTDDTTEATSTTDGSLQTDGGLSVAKDVIAGNDEQLLSDSAVLSLGADSILVLHMMEQQVQQLQVIQ